jgi:uncharacterized damage-inducible protein DinB
MAVSAGTAGVAFSELIAYTDYERAEWRAWFGAADGAARRLGITTGTGAGSAEKQGGIHTVGELILHIFVAETHHVERLTGRPLTEVAEGVARDVEALFDFGAHGRRALEAYVGSVDAGGWDVAREFEIFPGRRVRVTSRKFVTHILVHEIRHWAQVGTMARMAGDPGPAPDLLFSAVMDI